MCAAQRDTAARREGSESEWSAQPRHGSPDTRSRERTVTRQLNGDERRRCVSHDLVLAGTGRVSLCLPGRVLARLRAQQVACSLLPARLLVRLTTGPTGRDGDAPSKAEENVGVDTCERQPFMSISAARQVRDATPSQTLRSRHHPLAMQREARDVVQVDRLAARALPMRRLAAMRTRKPQQSDARQHFDEAEDEPDQEDEQPAGRVLQIQPRGDIVADDSHNKAEQRQRHETHPPRNWQAELAGRRQGTRQGTVCTSMSRLMAAACIADCWRGGRRGGFSRFTSIGAEDLYEVGVDARCDAVELDDERVLDPVDTQL
mmetsp:Transcript_5667/g.15041  ORF Transcript_5667/g.15041 Transcript_5667/m.15041 type:complete len:318 (+) Transcript_5667:117-1070(+)